MVQNKPNSLKWCTKVIKCNLSTYMGRDKLKIIDVARETGMNRATVSALYNEKAKKIDLEALDKLCALFHCQVGDLFEYVEK